MPTVIVTGATRGIGRAAAVELARRGAEVSVVGRDAARVRETAEEARIDVLANDAGALFTSRHVTSDGFEQTFALNHLAPFLLTNLLLERLTESRARVVTTASDAHKGGALDVDDLQSERGRYRGGRAYVEKERPVESSEQARDDELAAALWAGSEQLTALQGPVQEPATSRPAVDTSPDRHANPRKYVRIPFGIRAAPDSVHARSGRVGSSWTNP